MCLSRLVDGENYAKTERPVLPYSEGPKRPIRILTALHSFESGGVERVAIRLTSAWRDLGADARLIFGRACGATKADYQKLEFDRLGPEWIPTAKWETLWMILRLPDQVRGLQPDVLFCAGNTYSIVAVAMRLLLGRRCPLILAKISNDLARPDLGPLYRRAYHLWLRLQARWIDAFVALSPAMRREIHDIMKVDFDRIAVIGDPALTAGDVVSLGASPVCPRRSDRSTRYLLVGRLVKQKNIGLALTTFARVRNRGDSLTIVGDGPELHKLTRLARQLRITNQVRFTGYSSEVPAWLTWADVVLLSSDYEGLPAVLIEALAAGKPIVATDCTSSIHDLLGHGRFGLIVPRNDPVALGEAMQHATCHAFDKAGARKAADRHTLEYGSRAYLQTMYRLTKAIQRSAAG